MLSTYLTSTYATMSGSSMARPPRRRVVPVCLGEAGTPGPCSGLAPAQVIAQVRSDASAHSTAQQGYGFKGDRWNPVPGRSYGHLVWASNTSATVGARYHPLTPARIFDTRSGNGAPETKVGPGAKVDLQVTGRGGVPTGGIGAVVMSVTVTEPSAASHVTAWPSASPRPVASNRTTSPARPYPTWLDDQGPLRGSVSLHNNSGQTHVIADVVGWCSQ